MQDTISWLRQTGGKSAIDRFQVSKTETKPAAEKPAETKEKTEGQAKPAPKDSLELGASPANALRNAARYNSVGGVLGLSNISNTVSQNIQTQLNKIQDARQTRQQEKTDEQMNQAKNTQTEKNNTAQIQGQRNYVDLSAGGGDAAKNKVAIDGNKNVIQNYNGPQQDNTVNVRGDSNRALLGAEANRNAVLLNGSGNSVNMSQGASDNNVSIKGDNIKVEVFSSPNKAQGNSGWKINAEGSGYGISIVDGKATLKMSEDQKLGYKAEIDQERKTINITKLAEAS